MNTERRSPLPRNERRNTQVVEYEGEIASDRAWWGWEEECKSREAGFDGHAIKIVDFATPKATPSDLLVSDKR